MLVQGEFVARWVMDKVGPYTEGMTALGWEVDGVIVAGTAFEGYNGNNMFGAQRVDKSPPKKYWVSVVDYIFNHCKCKRFTVMIESDNIKSIKLTKHIGFEIETTLKGAGRNGDLIIMVLRPDNCKILNWGKKNES